jgi:predicted Rossmann-fold nucleotide-binding protein
VIRDGPVGKRYPSSVSEFVGVVQDAGVIGTFPDASPTEVETRAELLARIADGGLAGLTVQGVPLDSPPVDLTDVDVTDTLFVGCRFSGTDVLVDLVRRGAYVVPEFVELPFPTQPSGLYTPDDLAEGFATGGFEAMYDTRVYRHFLATGGARPDVRTAIGQRLHDTGIDDALADTIDGWDGGGAAGPVVGVMGGHAVRRGEETYRVAAGLGRALDRAGCLVVTGGGPGVMEAVNLGAHLSPYPDADLTSAIDLLAGSPDFTDHDPYTRAALEVRKRFPSDRGGLAVPTWLYGHEPANLFPAGIAKYFSNAIREDQILQLSRGGVVFAPGRAGTVQEVFQAVTKVFYGVDGAAGPLVFLGRRFWTETVPVRALLTALLAGSPRGDLDRVVHLTDDVAEAVELLAKS